MMFDLKHYPAYKDSGMPWLENLPEHWTEKRAKYFFREVDERSAAGDEELLSVSHITGVTPRSQKNVTMFLAESTVGHKLCQAGDVVVNTMWAWMGALGVAKQAGLVSPSYGVYRPLQPVAFLPGFLDELLRTPAYISEYVCRSTGITTSRLRLYPEQFLRIPFPCPPLHEQRLIMRFVSATDHQTRRYIRSTQKLIQLLAEERDVLTHDAVHSPHTRVLRLSEAATRVARPVSRQDTEIYNPIGLFNRGRGIFHKEPTRGLDLGDSTFYWIEEGDFVLSGQFAWEGAIAIAGPQDAGCVATHRYPVLRGKPNIAETAYLFSFFRTSFGQLLLNEHSRGAAGRNRPLNAATLMKEKIPIPPPVEQQRIIALVRLEKQLADSISKASSYLREYRARLIADVVTGKVDVREAAAMLPDEAEDVVPFEDAEVLPDGDEESESVDLGTSAEDEIS